MPARSRWSAIAAGLSTAAQLALVAAALVGLQAFLTPPAVIVHRPEQELEINASAAYFVYPRPGALYDSPGPLTGDPLYFTRLVEQVEVIFDFVLSSRPTVPFEVRRGLTLDVRAPGLWRKHIVLEPNTPVLAEGGRVAVAYLLDPVDLTAQIRDITRETGVEPEGTAYEVNLVASVETQMDHGRLQAVLSHAFQLLFRPELEVFEPSFSPGGRVTRALETREWRPNKLSLLGFSLPVVTARLGGTAAVGALGIWHMTRRRPGGPLPSRRERRLKRRLVLTRGLADELRRWPRLYLDNLDDLVRLASERDRAVLAAPADEPALYCLLAEGIAYIHVPDAGPQPETRP